MSLSKTELVFITITFYSILSVIMIFIGSSVNGIEQAQTTGIDSIIMPFTNIVTGFNQLPWWLNTVLFVPLISMITWLLLSSLPTLSGGS